ncbi:MAG: DUF1289 domain-containing protein [Colwellia sp.]|nr:DUF1289 domain-containing protein [Colwellia sp.]
MSNILSINRNKVVSPCVGKCQLIENDICMGCYRLIAEIGGWLNKSENEKNDIVVRCTKRKTKYLQMKSTI